MPLPPPTTDPTRVRLSRAALELFAERGFHGTGIRDIGDRAGVSTSGLYHYDMNIAYGNLVDLVNTQSGAYQHHA